MKHKKIKQIETASSSLFEKILEYLGFISLGFLVFEIIYIHLSFIFMQPINKFTLPISFGLYLILLATILFIQKSQQENKARIFGVGVFIIFSLIMVLLGKTVFSKTYDTSWDGQGYHSSGIITLTKGWNPVYQKELPIQLDNVTIFVQGYPKVLWEIQSSMYLTFGEMNAAKVTNLIAIVIACIWTYVLLRKLTVSPFLSGVIASFLTLQSIPVLQISTFMGDGFSYEMVICLFATLLLFMKDKKWQYLIASICAGGLIANTKFSNLPIILIAGLGFIFVLFNQLLDNTIKFPKYFKRSFLLMIFFGLIFFWVPYVSNILFYHSPFFPSNLGDMTYSYQRDNVPSNIRNENKFALLFYGIFSQSQTGSENTAKLKIPFTFSWNEITGATDMYNNRVGAAGPLFSGTIVLSVILLFLIFKQIPPNKKNYFYVSLGIIGVILVSTLIDPVPNLLRYNSQILLIPFTVLILGLIVTKNNLLIRILLFILLILLCTNTLFYSIPVMQKKYTDTPLIDKQLQQMKKKNVQYEVVIYNFYSAYTRLEENGIAYKKVKKLTCKNPEELYASSHTTFFCPPAM